MGNRYKYAKFQEKLFSSNENKSIFCPPLFRKQPIDLSYKMDLDFWKCLGREILPAYNYRIMILIFQEKCSGDKLMFPNVLHNFVNKKTQRTTWNWT